MVFLNCCKQDLKIEYTEVSIWNYVITAMAVELSQTAITMTENIKQEIRLCRNLFQAYSLNTIEVTFSIW